MNIEWSCIEYLVMSVAFLVVKLLPIISCEQVFFMNYQNHCFKVCVLDCKIVTVSFITYNFY
jgi:hypothetical protein